MCNNAKIVSKCAIIIGNTLSSILSNVRMVPRCFKILCDESGVDRSVVQVVLEIQYFSISPVRYHHDHLEKNGEQHEIMQPEQVFSSTQNCSKWSGNPSNKNSHIPF